MAKYNPFKAENKKWISENHRPDESVRDFTIRYNLMFDENRSQYTMKHYLKRMGCKQRDRSFTKEQDDWLLSHAPFMSVLETAREFNNRFGVTRDAQVLKVRCNRNLRVFHKHDRHDSSLPIGSETTTSQGYVFVKINNEKNVGFYKNWKQKHHLVWESKNGKIPKHSTLVFLDHNNSNCDIDNLYLVTKKIKREMCKKGWFFTDRYATLAAIKWCELFYSIKEVNNGQT